MAGTEKKKFHKGSTKKITNKLKNHSLFHLMFFSASSQQLVVRYNAAYKTTDIRAKNGSMEPLLSQQTDRREDEWTLRREDQVDRQT